MVGSDTEVVKITHTHICTYNIGKKHIHICTVHAMQHTKWSIRSWWLCATLIKKKGMSGEIQSTWWYKVASTGLAIFHMYQTTTSSFQIFATRIPITDSKLIKHQWLWTKRSWNELLFNLDDIIIWYNTMMCGWMESGHKWLIRMAVGTRMV